MKGLRTAACVLAATSASAKPIINCLVPEYRVKDGVDFAALGSVCTHVVLTGQEVNHEGKYQDVVTNIPRGDSLTALQKVQADTGLKVLIGVAGADRLLGFAGMMTEEEAQKRFIKQTVNLLDQNKFDGVYLDPILFRIITENDLNPLGAPVPWGFKEFGKFLLTLSKGLKSKNKLLALAYQPMREEYIYNQTSKSGKYITDAVDMFVAHGYDAILPADSRLKKSHHSSRAQPAVIKHFWQKSFPKDTLSKVTVGVPFYGRHAQRGQASESYAEIITGEPVEDDVDYASGHYFNNKNTVVGKLNYAAAEGFAGITINEVGQDLAMDNEKSLLRAVKEALSASGFPSKPSSEDYNPAKFPAQPKPLKPKEEPAEGEEAAGEEAPKQDL